MVTVFERDEAPVVFELAKSASGAWVQGAEFVFERGRLVLELPSPMMTNRAANVVITKNTESYSIENIVSENVWSFERQAEAFIEEVSGIRKPLTSGADAVKDLQLIEEIWRNNLGLG